MNTKRDYKSFDFLLAFLVISLAVLGIILIGSATHINKGELTPEFKGQILWVLSGIVIMLAAAFIDFQFICKFFIPFYILNLCLLVVVLVLDFGLPEGTPARSIILGSGGGTLLSIQPSEFNKIFMIIFLARYIDNNKEKINNLLILGSVFILTFVPVILIQKQPSLSASLVTVVIMFVMLLVAKLHYRYIVIGFAILIPIAFILFYDLSSATVKTGEDGVEVTYASDSMSPILIDKIMSNYQISRLKTFMSPVKDSEEYYQNQQAMLAIGSGKLTGKGLYNSVVPVPKAENDFIFTVLAEEFGFIGCVGAITVMFIIVIRCIIIAKRADIFYAKLIASAVGGMLAFQTFANVGVNTELLPNTGMIFPFISAGGSAMWVCMALVGLVLNIGMTKTKSMFED